MRKQWQTPKLKARYERNNPRRTAKKTERRSRREMVATVTNWVSENRKNNRIEELFAIRKFYGSEPLLSEI